MKRLILYVCVTLLFLVGCGGKGGGGDAAGFMNGMNGYTLTVTVVDATGMSGGDVEIVPERKFYKSGDTVTLIAYADRGWKLDRWEGPSTYGTRDSLIVTMDRNKEISAHFRRWTSYTVKFYSNYALGPDGKDIKLESKTVEDGSWIMLDSITFDTNGTDDITLNGLPVVFDKWRVTGIGGNDVYHAARTRYQVKGNVDFYAEWRRLYTVTFDGNGASSGTAPVSLKIHDGAALPLPAAGSLRKEGYAFGGWSDGSPEIIYAANDGYVVKNDVKFFAVWLAASGDVIDEGEFVRVAGGSFEFGEDKINRTVAEFYIGKREVTQKLWQGVMGYNWSVSKGDDLPVENVSWVHVTNFIDKLNMLKSDGEWDYYLPSELEWEFAARGGGNSSGYRFSGGDDIDEAAWYKGNSDGKTHAVGTKKANELGIFDMSGNVLEWVYDESVSAAFDYYGETRRVIRGGSYAESEQNCTVFRQGRDWGEGGADKELGFRLARMKKQ